MPGSLIWSVGFGQAHPENTIFVAVEAAALLVLAALAVRLNLRLLRN
ncbi:MAG: hypothetical protein M3Y57_13955 [Acidobacteriota bacterium]|nr:hypothetical protein [Acidobacteriota bacterium]